jgi:hypothetical protein
VHRRKCSSGQWLPQHAVTACSRNGCCAVIARPHSVCKGCRHMGNATLVSILTLGLSPPAARGVAAHGELHDQNPQVLQRVIRSIRVTPNTCVPASPSCCNGIISCSQYRVPACCVRLLDLPCGCGLC